jgi:hypothetical protein
MSTYRQTHYQNILGGIAALWVKVDGDGPAYWWQQGGVWYQSDTLGATVTIDGGAWVASMDLYNGHRYWSGGGKFLWYSGAEEAMPWVISNRLGACIDERWRDADVVKTSAEGVEPEVWCVIDDYTGETVSNHGSESAANAERDAYNQYVGNEWWSGLLEESEDGDDEDELPDGVEFVARGIGRGGVEGEYNGTPMVVVYAFPEPAAAPVATNRTGIYVAQVAIWL